MVKINNKSIIASSFGPSHSLFILVFIASLLLVTLTSTLNDVLAQSTEENNINIVRQVAKALTLEM